MPANRTQIITELFEKLPNTQVNGMPFSYTSEEMWAFFDELVKDSDSGIKKLRKPKNSSNNSDKPVASKRGLSTYNLWMKEWHEKNKGEKMSKQDLSALRSEAWKKISEEEKNLLQIRVDKLNEENGIPKKMPTVSKPKSYKKQMEEYTAKMEELAEMSDGDEKEAFKASIIKPVKPEKKSPTSSPKTNSPLNIDTQNVDSGSGSDSSPQVPTPDSAASDFDQTRENWEQISSPRKKWVSGLGWKKSKVNNFKAWAMYNDPDTYGPDGDDAISTANLKELKQLYKYEELKDSTDTEWYNFLDNK